MKNHQIWKGAGAVAATLSLLTVLALSGCGSSQTTTSTSAAQAQTASFTATESISLLSASYQVDLQNAVKITLSGTSASTSGSGVSVSGSTVTITAGGTYALSGTLTNGTVVVDAKGQTVVLALNGASITASSGAAINVQNAELAVVYTVSGTDNALSGYNTDTTDTNAALYSKDSLILDGEGSLSVTDTGNNGIQSKDSLAVLGGTVTVSAANHGIKANDSLEVTDGTITITCGGDGLKSASTDSTDVGYVHIYGGTVTVTSSGDGVQAESSLTVEGGTLDLTCGTGSDASQISAGANTPMGFGGGNTGSSGAMMPGSSSGSSGFSGQTPPDASTSATPSASSAAATSTATTGAATPTIIAGKIIVGRHLNSKAHMAQIFGVKIWLINKRNDHGMAAHAGKGCGLITIEGQQGCSIQRGIAHGAYAVAQDRRHKTHGFKVVKVNVFAQGSGKAQGCKAGRWQTGGLQQCSEGKGKSRLDLQQFFHICCGQPQTVRQTQPRPRLTYLLTAGFGQFQPAGQLFGQGHGRSRHKLAVMAQHARTQQKGQ